MQDTAYVRIGQIALHMQQGLCGRTWLNRGQIRVQGQRQKILVPQTGLVPAGRSQQDTAIRQARGKITAATGQPTACAEIATKRHQLLYHCLLHAAVARPRIGAYFSKTRGSGCPAGYATIAHHYFNALAPVMFHYRSLCLLAACGLAACEGDVSVAITDAPSDDAVRVVVRVTGLEFNRADGTNQVVNLDSPLDVNLSELTAGRSLSLVSREELPAGDYTAVELILDIDTQQLDSYIELDDGSEISLVLAAGANLRARKDFQIEDGESLKLTIDFDLRRSLTATENAAGDRILNPALRLVQDDLAGSVSGRIDTALLESETCDNGDAHDTGNVIYAFLNADITPDDIDGIAPDPVSTGLIQADATTGESTYTLAFLESGDYTLAISCQGRLDEPQTDDAVIFAATANVSIRAGATLAHDF